MSKNEKPILNDFEKSYIKSNRNPYITLEE